MSSLDIKSKGHGNSDARDRILATASQLFYKDGIKSTGVAAIVREAGVTKMTLYAHFSGKDELIATYLKDRDDRWRQSLAQVTNGLEVPTDKLLVVFEAYGEWLVSDSLRGCGFINACAEISDPTHPARVVAAEHKLAVREHLAYLAREICASDPNELAERLLLLLEGAAVTSMIRQDDDPLYTAKSTASELIFKSIA